MTTWFFAALALGWLIRMLLASRDARRIPASLPSGGGPTLSATHVELRVVELEIPPGDRAEALATLGMYGASEREILSVPADGATMLVFALRRVSRYAKRIEGHTEVLQPHEARQRLEALGHDLASRRAKLGPSGYRDGPRELAPRPDEPVALAIAIALETHPTIAARPFRGKVDDFVRDLVMGREVLIRLAFHPTSSPSA